MNSVVKWHIKINQKRVKQLCGLLEIDQSQSKMTAILKMVALLQCLFNFFTVKDLALYCLLVFHCTMLCVGVCVGVGVRVCVCWREWVSENAAMTRVPTKYEELLTMIKLAFYIKLVENPKSFCVQHLLLSSFSVISCQNKNQMWIIFLHQKDVFNSKELMKRNKKGEMSHLYSFTGE